MTTLNEKQAKKAEAEAQLAVDRDVIAAVQAQRDVAAAKEQLAADNLRRATPVAQAGFVSRQALETGAETVATSCPFCMVMMKDGLADAASAAPTAGVVSARDIAEILADVIEPAPIPAGRRLPVLQ